MGGTTGLEGRWLVVDDDRMLLAQLGHQLRQRGASVVLAGAPLHALWVLERTEIDVVVCDFALASGDDGLGLLDTVRTRWPDTVRILITGWGSRLAAAGRCDAAQATLFKPLDLGALERAATDLMSAARAARRSNATVSTPEDP